jgi:hypothetical protein
MGDSLLNRIFTVCMYYRGAHWQLNYDSADGGFWNLVLANPEKEEDEPETMRVGPFMMVKAHEPIFAIRCQGLEVVAEAVEHWHSSVLARDVNEN